MRQTIQSIDRTVDAFQWTGVVGDVGPLLEYMNEQGFDVEGLDAAVRSNNHPVPGAVLVRLGSTDAVMLQPGDWVLGLNGRLLRLDQPTYTSLFTIAPPQEPQA